MIESGKNARPRSAFETMFPMRRRRRESRRVAIEFFSLITMTAIATKTMANTGKHTAMASRELRSGMSTPRRGQRGGGLTADFEGESTRITAGQGRALCEPGGGGTLKPWSKCGCFRSVFNSLDSRMRPNPAGSDHPQEEHWQKSEKCLLVSCVAGVWQQQCDHNDHDRCDCDPEPGTLCMECIHSGWEDV